MRVRVLMIAVLSLGACGEGEIEFADWTMPVDEGVPVLGYAAVGLAEREGRLIETTEDLVLGSDPTDPEQAFYRATTVVPDLDGNIYVLDADGLRVQAFDPAGNFLRSIGREGQGPGEFERPTGLLISGDRLILRAGPRRMSIWTRAGEHVRDRLMDENLQQPVGTDGGFVAWHMIREDPSNEAPQRLRQRRRYAGYDAEGDQREVLLELVEPPPTSIETGSMSMMIGGTFPIQTYSPRFGATRDGMLVVTLSEEYELHAFGTRRWSARVAWPREPVLQQDRDNVAASLTRGGGTFDGLDLDGLDWVARFPAIDNVEIDGHGHVYVYPFFKPLDGPIEPDGERPELDRPVDVFSEAGELLYSGWIGVPSWTGALGDFVYRSRLSDVTDEYEVVRHRLIEPFR